MTQILVCRCEEGIVLASDSRAVVYPSQEEKDRRFIHVKKVFQLGSRTVAVAAGAGYGTLLCEGLERHLLEMDLDHYAAIAGEAPRFLQAQLDGLRKNQPRGIVPDELNRFFLVIAGHAPGGEMDPFRFLLLGVEGPEGDVRVIPTGSVVAVPRHMGAEYRLVRFHPDAGGLNSVEAFLEELLMWMARKNEEIGAPFHFTRITQEGISTRIRWR